MSPQSTFIGVKDISSREQLILELKNSNKLLSSIIEFYPDATLIIDNDGRVIAWNKAIEEMTGVKAEEMISKGDYEYAIPFYGQRKPLLLNMLDVPPAKINERYKDISIRNDKLEALAVKAKIKGEDVVIWATACKLYGADGKVVGAIESIRDITDQKRNVEELRRHKDHLEELVAERTADLSEVNWELQKEIAERKQVEEELSKNEKFLKNIFECIQDGLTILDNNMNIIRINRTIENWFPHMHPILGKKCYYAYHLRSGPCENCPSIRAINEKTPQNGVVPFNGPNGIFRGWMELYSFPLFDDDGNVVGVIEQSRDITGRRRSEEALQEAKAEAELYLDLMGHDINNLNQIGLGFLEMALEAPGLDDRSRSLLSRPLAALENSSRLIDNVRKLQKARSGELHRMEIDIGRVLSDVQANYSHIPCMDVTINYTYISGCMVMANELLYDVFSNLVGNAIKHSTRKPVISIGLEKALEGGKLHYKIIVEDNGPGISDKLKPRIFDRHLRGSTKAKGSGIGLYLVKTLVESYGGWAVVEDRIPGDRSEGSRFVVMLPAQKSSR